MRKNFFYAVLLLAAGACQRVDVSPSSPASDANAVAGPAANKNGAQAAKQPGGFRCGTSPQTVLGYTVRWGYESTNTYFSSPTQREIITSYAGAYQPVRMRVIWDPTVCFGPSPAQYMKVMLHLPDGTVKEVGNFNPSAGQTSGVIEIPPVIISNDFAAFYNDADLGQYSVSLDYGLNTPYMGPDGASAGNSSNAVPPLICNDDISEIGL